LGYDGNTVAGTWAMMQYHAWYIGYDGGLLMVLLFAQMDYAASTKGRRGL